MKTPDPFARRPDIDQLSLQLMTHQMSPEAALCALQHCIDYIARVEMSLDELRDKCLETAGVLRE